MGARKRDIYKSGIKSLRVGRKFFIATPSSGQASAAIPFSRTSIQIKTQQIGHCLSFSSVFPPFSLPRLGNLSDSSSLRPTRLNFLLSFFGPQLSPTSVVHIAHRIQCTATTKLHNICDL